MTPCAAATRSCASSKRRTKAGTGPFSTPAGRVVEKRVVFRSAWLPYALVAPQIVITVLFFFWPASQAVWYSFQLQDAFGLSSQFVGLQNFAHLFNDSNYLESFKVTALFSV